METEFPENNANQAKHEHSLVGTHDSPSNNDRKWDNFEVSDDLDTEWISHVDDVIPNNGYSLSRAASSAKLQNIGFIVDKQLFIGRVVAHMYEDNLRNSEGVRRRTRANARQCYRVQILAPCIGDSKQQHDKFIDKLEQFLESKFIIQSDIFITVYSNIVASNIRIHSGL